MTKTRNLNMTKYCRHKEKDICDYCLVAYGQHGEDEQRGKKVRLSHTMEGQRFTCGECYKPKTYKAKVNGRTRVVTIPEKD